MTQKPFAGWRPSICLHHYDVKLLLVIERFNLYFNLFATKFPLPPASVTLRLSGFGYCRRSIDQETVGIVSMVDTNNLALDFIAYRSTVFTVPRPWQVGIRYTVRAQCFRGCVYASSPPAPAPTNHYAGFHPVFAQRLLQRVQHAAAVIFIIHIDEINNDIPAQITQPYWRAIACVASILVLKMVSSRLR